MMEDETKNPVQDREKTDESLRTERRNTDSAMTERRAELEKDADALVGLARDQADAVLDTARDKADQDLDSADRGARERAAIVTARAWQDAVLEDERAIADEALRRERAEHSRILALLLPLERETTDRHLLIERARSDDRLAQRDDFMGMVSHDLRNLMCGVVMEAALLSDKASESEEGRRTVAAMNRLQQYAARMNRIIGDLIDIVSIDAGRLSIRPASCAADALLTEAVGAFAASALEKGIFLGFETVGGSLKADFDYQRMLQVLANLISNALKFSPRGGKVVVRAERAAEALHFSVSDTGMGIPASMLEAVFERFWQVGKNDQRGLGLGLYISNCIVEAHGGRIWVESKLGEGSSFHFTIPVCSCAWLDATEPSSPEPDR
ncbi:MAG TPA: ATP-binding protein [Thermoanaerobaculia bacterium]|jgi:signal transduction histidine kinase|nr:ATP-binding protein [Thermoanaerobaculia bacterium]